MPSEPAPFGAPQTPPKQIGLGCLLAGDRQCSRRLCLAIVGCLWAVIFLPCLGAGELKGEEGRRILPAVEMLRNGRWAVPVVGGEDYYNKPPGINWLVAASFLLSGSQDEFAARMPSAMAMLAVAATLAVGRSPWLNSRGRFIAAIAFLSNAILIEKGRLIEIEAVYVALTALAILLWLDAWAAGRSRWMLWLPACTLIGYGVLVKGPFHGVVFYAVVFFVLYYAHRLKELFTWAHLAGIGGHRRHVPGLGPGPPTFRPIPSEWPPSGPTSFRCVWPRKPSPMPSGPPASSSRW